jgi:heat shock protein HslJ
MKLLFLAAALLISACTWNAPSPTVPPVPTPTPTPSPAPTGVGHGGLDGRTFLGSSFTQAGMDRPLVANTQVRLNFTVGNQIFANAGCNHIAATYRLENGTLQISEFQSTAMGCERQLETQEVWVTQFLGSGPSLLLDGNELTLTGADLVGKFLDVEVADPDLTLGNRVWTITAVITDGVASSVPVGIVGSLDWKEDGGVIVSTGCNTGVARPTIEGAQIMFGPIGLTKMACAGAAGQLERLVVAVLGESSLLYEIQSHTLRLSSGASGLVLTAP